MKSRALGLVLIGCAGCASGGSLSATVGKLIGPSDLDRSAAERLQDQVARGIDPDYRDPCRAPLWWALLDDESAGEQLDQLLATSATFAPARERICLSYAAGARLIRQLRLGLFDPALDRAHPIPAVRAVAERWLSKPVATTSSGAAARAVELCARAAGDLASKDVHRVREGLSFLLFDRFRRVEAPLDPIPVSSKPCPLDPALKEELSSGAQQPLIAAITLWEHHPDLGGSNWKPFAPDEGLTPFRGVEVDRNAATSCSRDFDCAFANFCIRADEHPSGRGVCGRLVDSRGVASVSAGRIARVCRADEQCPAFFSCRSLELGVGVCVRR